MTGTFAAATTSGTRHIVVVSSPHCGRRLNPSATTASTPAASAFRANAALDATWMTVQPADCRWAVQVRGDPALVNTTGARSSAVAMCFRPDTGAE